MNRRAIAIGLAISSISVAILVIYMRFLSNSVYQVDANGEGEARKVIGPNYANRFLQNKQGPYSNIFECNAGIKGWSHENTVVNMRMLLASGRTTEVCEAALVLRKSPEIKVRMDVVHLLGKIGGKALPELSDYLYDDDPAVSREAFRLWEGIVSGLPKENKKTQILLANLLVMTDPERIKELVAVLAAMPRASAVKALIDVAHSSNPTAAEAARAAYCRLTGTSDGP